VLGYAYNYAGQAGTPGGGIIGRFKSHVGADGGNEEHCVTETNQSVEFGHPEFWGQAYASFPKFFEVIPRAGDALNGLTMHRRYENVNPWEKVIFNLGLLTGFSVMELITLVGNGFGPGAMKIARTILESSINAEYLRLFP